MLLGCRHHRLQESQSCGFQLLHTSQGIWWRGRALAGLHGLATGRA
jgi:hypothetical protein